MKPNSVLSITNVTPEGTSITAHNTALPHTGAMKTALAMLRLDYLSCVFTVFSAVLIGKRCWEGWAIAAANSVVICIIAIRTAQIGFVPANLFCIVLCAWNVRNWRKTQLP
jgi:hypothetical protein